MERVKQATAYLDKAATEAKKNIQYVVAGWRVRARVHGEGSVPCTIPHLGLSCAMGGMCYSVKIPSPIPCAPHFFFLTLSFRALLAGAADLQAASGLLANLHRIEDLR